MRRPSVNLKGSDASEAESRDFSCCDHLRPRLPHSRTTVPGGETTKCASRPGIAETGRRTRDEPDLRAEGHGRASPRAAQQERRPCVIAPPAARSWSCCAASRCTACASVARRDAMPFTRSHADSAERRYRAASTTERIKGTTFRVTTAATEENSQDTPLTEQTPRTTRPLKSAIVRVCDIRRRRDGSGQDRATMRSVAEGGTCFIGASPATRLIVPRAHLPTISYLCCIN